MLGPCRQSVYCGNRQSRFYSIESSGEQEPLDSECSIGWRLLCPDAVGVDLAIDLGEQITPAGFAQIIRTRKGRRHCRADDNACELGNPMVVRRRVQRGKSSNPINMCKEKL